MSEKHKTTNTKWVLPVIIGLAISSTIIMSFLIVQPISSEGGQDIRAETNSVKYLNFVYYFKEIKQTDFECINDVCMGGGSTSTGIGHGCTEISDGILLDSENKLTLADWIAGNERRKQQDPRFDFQYFISDEKGLYC